MSQTQLRDPSATGRQVEENVILPNVKESDLDALRAEPSLNGEPQPRFRWDVAKNIVEMQPEPRHSRAIAKAEMPLQQGPREEYPERLTETAGEGGSCGAVGVQRRGGDHPLPLLPCSYGPEFNTMMIIATMARMVSDNDIY